MRARNEPDDVAAPTHGVELAESGGQGEPGAGVDWDDLKPGDAAGSSAQGDGGAAAERIGAFGLDEGGRVASREEGCARV